MEFTNQEKYEAVTLTSSQWVDLIGKAQAASKSEQHMFILRCLANEQKISNGVILAFRGNVIEDATSRGTAALTVDVISDWAKEITGNTKAAIFEWNPLVGEWSIGSYQLQALRKALGCENFIPKGSGVTR